MKNRFKNLWFRIGATTDAEEAFGSLSKAYTQDHRFYHNLGHIRSCLEEFDNVRDLALDPNAVEFAIWYHDIVYEPKGTQNELRSAEFAFDMCVMAGVARDFARKIRELIIVTTHDVVPEGPDQRLILDIDLSILGKPAREYDQYEQKIRSEYSFVSESEYRDARASILQTFLNRPSIYTTEYFVKKYEQQARENLQRSISDLRKSLTSGDT
jgi:predicted metal-dependent HD superfamily phosphohydrolase